MPFTVWGSFKAFRESKVDLVTSESQRARASRDYLYDRIRSLGSTTLLTGITLSFGSFARRTKMRPLDDIDCFAMIECAGGTEWMSDSAHFSFVYPGSSSFLQAYVGNNGRVNSTRVLNRIKTILEAVAQYGNAEIGRNGSAIVLNLPSYSWSFDVVPACPVSNQDGQTICYVIPDGDGDWKRTDPRIDAARTTEANQRHGGLLLPAIRTVKFWNQRTHKPRLDSYLVETLMVNRALSTPHTYISIQGAVEDLLYGVLSGLDNICSDPAGHGPALDANLTLERRASIRSAVRSDWYAASLALAAESRGDDASAIELWGSVFGPSFPAYG